MIGKSAVVYIMLLFIACTFSSTKSDKISSAEYVKSLKKKTTAESIAAIDSVLQVGKINDEIEAQLYFKKGKLLSVLQKDKEAIISFNKALKYFKKKKERAYIAEIYWHLGSENAFLSSKVEATEYLLKAQELNKKLNDKTLEANIDISLAHIKYLYKDYLSAIGYTKEAIAIQEEEKDSLGLSATYNNLAVIYKNIGEFSDAIDYNNKSLKLNILLKDKSAIAKSYNNLGGVSEQMGHYKEAINYYKKAIALNNEIGSVNTSAYRNLANLYLQINDIEQSKEIYLNALDKLKKHTNIKIEKDIYNVLLHIALQQKDFNNSLKYQKKRDSLYLLQKEQENQENLILAEKQYQLVAKENDLLKEKNINRKNIFIFSTILLSLLSLFFLLLFRYVKNKNKKLKAEKEILNLEQTVLRSQMNPHFIFNALSAIQNSLLDNEPLKSASYLSRFAKLIRQNFDFIDKKGIILAEEIDALKNYMETQKLRYHDKFDYEINIFANVDINSIEIPPLLLQPFVENAIEHGFKRVREKGKLEITIFKQENLICYSIKDNGIGFEEVKNDNKKHATDIFLKRLELRGLDEGKSFKIQTTEQGTNVRFCLKLP